MRRRERANAICESIRALDATGMVLIWIIFVINYF